LYPLGRATFSLWTLSSLSPTSSRPLSFWRVCLLFLYKLLRQAPPHRLGFFSPPRPPTPPCLGHTYDPWNVSLFPTFLSLWEHWPYCSPFSDLDVLPHPTFPSLFPDRGPHSDLPPGLPIAFLCFLIPISPQMHPSPVFIFRIRRIPPSLFFPSFFP